MGPRPKISRKKRGGKRMLGALITIPRDKASDFSVIMPVTEENYEAVRRLRTLGDLRAWLENHADRDPVAGTILVSLQQEVGDVSNRYPLDIHMEMPGQSRD